MNWAIRSTFSAILRFLMLAGRIFGFFKTPVLLFISSIPWFQCKNRFEKRTILGQEAEKKTEEKRLMRIVANTSLPAVDRPNADCWNTARSCQHCGPYVEHLNANQSDYEDFQIEIFFSIAKNSHLYIAKMERS